MGQACRNYLEIGVLHGGSMIMLMQDAHPTKFVGAGTFTYYGDIVDPVSNVLVSKANALTNIEKNNPHNHEYELIKGDSQDPSTLNDVKDACENTQLLYIDADHTGEGVATDFKNYCQLVSPEGVIVIDGYENPRWPEVKPAVDSLKLKGFTRIGQVGNMFIVEKRRG